MKQWRPFPRPEVKGTGERARASARSTVSARVIRADGTVEDLGVISVNGRPARTKRLWQRLLRRS